jgi:hypothetical protein
MNVRRGCWTRNLALEVSLLYLLRKFRWTVAVGLKSLPYDALGFLLRAWTHVQTLSANIVGKQFANKFRPWMWTTVCKQFANNYSANNLFPFGNGKQHMIFESVDVFLNTPSIYRELSPSKCSECRQARIRWSVLKICIRCLACGMCNHQSI